MTIKSRLKNAMEVAKMKKTIKAFLQLGLALLVMIMAVASASAVEDNSDWEDYGLVSFKVGVNDYPDHRDYTQSKNIPHAFVNKYRVELGDAGFKVNLVEIKETNELGYATFTVHPNEMVYFEGFKTRSDAERGSEIKRSMAWTAPPYKNFRTASDELCQTDYATITKMLGGSESSACANSLSTPYIDLTPAVPELPDLAFTEVGYVSENYESVAFRATVINKGTKDVSNFQISFTANGKENLLTYAPTLKAGETVTIRSWALDYFDLEDNQATLVQFRLDPRNQISEVDENNNYADMASHAWVGENYAKYLVFTRSKDVSAQAKVARYVYNPTFDMWELAEVVDSRLKEVSTEQGALTTAYVADQKVDNARITAFFAFYPDSQIPSEIRPGIFPGGKMVLEGSLINGEAVACSHTRGCSQQYASHAEEMVYYKDGKFKTFYELSGIEEDITGVETDELIDNNAEEITTGTDVSLPVICTQEARRCADGSYVSRTGPKCEFAACPSERVTACANGCSYDGKCLPFGTRIKEVKEGLYCDLGGKMLSQMTAAKSCSNDYECESNSCLSGQCVNLSQRLEEQQNLLEKIMAWLSRLFGGK